MKHNYTFNQLIKFLFGEGDLLDRFEVEHAIATEPKIAAAYSAMQEAKMALPKVRFAPKKATIANILEYSKMTAQPA